MSVQIDWTTLTSGPDGTALAERIRDFIHDKFQTVPLPRFIKLVKVQTFDFGSIAPDLEIKDICDPLPDFYEKNESDSSDSEDESSGDEVISRRAHQQTKFQERKTKRWDSGEMSSSSSDIGIQSSDLELRKSSGQKASPLAYIKPGIPGGTSNLSYFHTQLANGLSGSRTPLAAVAGAHLRNGIPEYSNLSNRSGNRNTLKNSSTFQPPTVGVRVQEKTSSLNSLAPINSSKPQSLRGSGVEETLKQEPCAQSPPHQIRSHKPRIEDIQTVFRVRYSGDIKLSLTAELLLDYPMPSFVGIPVQLKITGLTFDGVAVLASIRKKAHFCFLSPEDAILAIGNEPSEDKGSTRAHIGSLLQEIKVESQIGKRDNGKQILKNVGKVEKFVLEQVRRIFEDEFVYPSFWTFLI